MKYWAYFLAKLAAIAGLLAGIWIGLHKVWPEPLPFMRVKPEEPFGKDLWYTFAMLGYWLVGVGLVYLAVLDQRYRCRTCLRRLRMPVMRGAWDNVLLGPPRTEYICAWGHGTLRVSEVNFASPKNTDWRPIDDMWKELKELQEVGEK